MAGSPLGSPESYIFPRTASVDSILGSAVRSSSAPLDHDEDSLLDFLSEEHDPSRRHSHFVHEVRVPHEGQEDSVYSASRTRERRERHERDPNDLVRLRHKQASQMVRHFLNYTQVLHLLTRSIDPFILIATLHRRRAGKAHNRAAGRPYSQRAVRGGGRKMQSTKSSLLSRPTRRSERQSYTPYAPKTVQAQPPRETK